MVLPIPVVPRLLLAVVARVVLQLPAVMLYITTFRHSLPASPLQRDPVVAVVVAAAVAVAVVVAVAAAVVLAVPVVVVARVDGLTVSQLLVALIVPPAAAAVV